MYHELILQLIEDLQPLVLAWVGGNQQHFCLFRQHKNALVVGVGAGGFIRLGVQETLTGKGRFKC